MVRCINTTTSANQHRAGFLQTRKLVRPHSAEQALRCVRPIPSRKRLLRRERLLTSRAEMPSTWAKAIWSPPERLTTGSGSFNLMRGATTRAADNDLLEPCGADGVPTGRRGRYTDR